MLISLMSPARPFTFERPILDLLCIPLVKPRRAKEASLDLLEEGLMSEAGVLLGKSLKALCALQERSALKAQKQEEKASQKASKEAAKALLKLEKDRVKFEGNDSRGNSVDGSGSRRLLMRRQVSVLLTSEPQHTAGPWCSSCCCLQSTID